MKKERNIMWSSPRMLATLGSIGTASVFYRDPCFLRDLGTTWLPKPKKRVDLMDPFPSL